MSLLFFMEETYVPIDQPPAIAHHESGGLEHPPVEGEAVPAPADGEAAPAADGAEAVEGGEGQAAAEGASPEVAAAPEGGAAEPAAPAEGSPTAEVPAEGNPAADAAPAEGAEGEPAAPGSPAKEAGTAETPEGSPKVSHAADGDTVSEVEAEDDGSAVLSGLRSGNTHRNVPAASIAAHSEFMSHHAAHVDHSHMKKVIQVRFALGFVLDHQST